MSALLILLVSLLFLTPWAGARPAKGYYQFPAIHADTIVFGCDFVIGDFVLAIFVALPAVDHEASRLINVGSEFSWIFEAVVS